MKCPKCGYKIGVGMEIVSDKKALSQGVPHIKAVKTDYLIRCSICETEWCCLECAIESDAVSHADYNKSQKTPTDRPLIIKCCHCTNKKPCWK